MPTKLKIKIQRIKKFFLGSTKESNTKVFISFAKDKKTTTAVRILKSIGLKPILTRKLWEQVNNINRTREPTRMGLDLKMFAIRILVTKGGEVLPGGERPLIEQIRMQLAHYGSLIRVPYGEPFRISEALEVEDITKLGVSTF